MRNKNKLPWVRVLHGDCLDRMHKIEDQSVDMILCDLPYGTTACKWDSVIPLDKLWLQYARILKPYHVIVLTSLQPFSTELIKSRLEWFKYSYVWIKSRALGFQNAKLRPMTRHEDILVFSTGNAANRAKNLMPYYPQGLKPLNKIVKGLKNSNTDNQGHRMARPNHKAERLQEFTGYPDTLIEVPNEGKTVHPTQKPVALMEYLIKTYTNEGQTVLDNCMGSGTTGVACMNTGRNFIGIERDAKYYEIATNRIKEAKSAKYGGLFK
jgi:site-specific DNA-methyltransferase (adenine-specific)